MKKEKTKKEIILDACLNLEFVAGLKQFRDYSKEDKQRLIDCLSECTKAFLWLTNKRLEYILYNGIRGNYGDFYSLNERTLNQWINKYYESNKSNILIELNPKNEDDKVSDEEKEHWRQAGIKRFLKNWEHSKNGRIPDLDEWAPYWYNKMIEKKLLVEDRYNPDNVTIEQKKMLRLDRPFFGESEIRSAVRNKIWKMFIHECIQKGPDLSKLII